MSGISVYAHIRRDADVTVSMQDGENGKYATLDTGQLTLFINDREKLLELASQLEQTAQKWEGES